ncbi:hypothetical protein JL36_10185 [Lactococcus cremoris]|nr:hypothetical protein JL36_10185 [Lactococcus cremoris]
MQHIVFYASSQVLCVLYLIGLAKLYLFFFTIYQKSEFKLMKKYPAILFDKQFELFDLDLKQPTTEEEEKREIKINSNCCRIIIAGNNFS